MNRTAVIMSAVLAALLLVCCVIVVGSMDQASQISSQRAQLTELRQKLQEAGVRLDNQSANAELLSASLNAVRQERDDALAALSEANDAVVNSSQMLKNERDAREAEALEMNERYEQSVLRADELDARLQAALGERNGATLRVKELEEELKASAEAAAGERSALEARISELEGEIQAIEAAYAEAVEAIEAQQTDEADNAEDAESADAVMYTRQTRTRTDSNM